MLPGSYVIMDDGVQPRIDEHGEQVIVTVQHNGLTLSRPYTFGIDPPPCRCHVRKLAGPDIIVFPK